jgi:hypothetical protein
VIELLKYANHFTAEKLLGNKTPHYMAFYEQMITPAQDWAKGDYQSIKIIESGTLDELAKEMKAYRIYLNAISPELRALKYILSFMNELLQSINPYEDLKALTDIQRKSFFQSTSEQLYQLIKTLNYLSEESNLAKKQVKGLKGNFLSIKKRRKKSAAKKFNKKADTIFHLATFFKELLNHSIIPALAQEYPELKKALDSANQTSSTRSGSMPEFSDDVFTDFEFNFEEDETNLTAKTAGAGVGAGTAAITAQLQQSTIAAQVSETNHPTNTRTKPSLSQLKKLVSSGSSITASPVATPPTHPHAVGSSFSP